MPSSSSILTGLAAVANGAFQIAVLWHVLLALTLAAVVAGWRPRERHALTALALLPACVATLAFAFGNPFNGAVFSLLAAGTAITARTRTFDRVQLASGSDLTAGAALIVFAWFYPHFLRDASLLTYGIGAPMGLLPCPTLALLIGLTLLVRGRFGTVWPTALIAAGLLYGVIGVFRLGVSLDAGLLAGAAWLALRSVPRWLPRAETRVEVG